MKLSLKTIICLLLLNFLFSCTLEKRVQYPGYYVHSIGNKFEKAKTPSDKESETINPCISTILESFTSKNESEGNTATASVLDSSVINKQSNPSSEIKALVKKINSTIQLGDKQINKNQENKPQLNSQIKSIVNQNPPCPNTGRKKIKLGKFLMVFGLIFAGISFLVALSLMSVGSSPALLVVPLIGLVMFISGIVIYKKGKAIPPPKVIRTEEISGFGNSDSQLIHPSFDFEAPMSSRKPLVSLVLLNPSYALRFEQSRISPFKDFAENMKNDFKELLSHRQYTFRGPFETYDDLVYNDKANTDLMVEIIIDMKLNYQNMTSTLVNSDVYENRYWSCGAVEKVLMGKQKQYSYSGDIEIGGSINVVVSEVMTKEKVWTKSVSIHSQRIHVSSEKQYLENYASNNMGILYNDPGIYNPVTQVLGNIYQVTMEKAWDYLDPRELELLIPQVQKIRENSGYGRNISR